METGRLLALFRGFRDDLRGLTSRVGDFEKGLVDAAAVAAGELPPAPAGPEGKQGPDGEPGPTGPRGSAGDSGSVGAPGATGLNGREGLPGPVGEVGGAGPRGPAGPKGPIGPAGPKGGPGPAGPDGPKGPAGNSVTAARIANGRLMITVDGKEKEIGDVSVPARRVGGPVGGGGGGLAAAAGFSDMPIVNLSATPYAAVKSSTLIVDATSEPIVINLTAVGPARQTRFEIKKTDSSANPVTITPAGGELIDGSASFALELQHESVIIRSDGADWWVL